MKKNLNKFRYWFLTGMIAFTLVFSSCSKEEINDAPILEQTAEETVLNNDFSNMLGCLLTPAEEYQKIPVAEEVRLKATSATKYLPCPSVGNQGSDGACVGWGTAYAARSIMTGANTRFSPSYVYNQIKVSDCASGSYPADALNIIYNQGVCTYNSMPYYSNNCYTQPNSSQVQEASNYKISGYQRVSINSNSIRSQIAYGRPVVVAGRVDSYFQNLGYNRILTTVTGQGGGHCYCVVGYNDTYRCFRVLNSWGSSWATDGYGWISYDIVGQLWSEAYIMY